MTTWFAWIAGWWKSFLMTKLKNVSIKLRKIMDLIWLSMLWRCMVHAQKQLAHIVKANRFPIILSMG